MAKCPFLASLLLGCLSISVPLASAQTPPATVDEDAAALLNQISHEWTYAELVKAADLVVIVKLQSTQTLREALNKGDHPQQPAKDEQDHFVSTFDVAAVLSGSTKQTAIEVVYRGYRPDVIGGKGLVKFEKKIVLPSYVTAEIAGEDPTFSGPSGTYSIVPEYLLFLKRRPDGRFSLASGVFRPESSIRILNARPAR